ncbi:MAG: hypothetical protein OXU71_01675 [Gammaproteobacteria bacterium]|nr:hypothetical protein [Gammaproteobacteria bacterium]
MDTKIPESSLNDAERKVRDAFRAHEPTVSVAGAEIQGDFLRDLFLGKYDEDADYRGTCIVGAVVPDALNMEFYETKFPMRFHDCHFEQTIKFQQLACPELDFSGCTLKNGFDARMVKVAGIVDMREVDAEYTVDFDGAEIGGQLNCSGGNLRPRNKNNKSKVALTAQSIKVTGDVFLRNGFNAVGEVRLPGAKIGSQLDCSGGVFQNENRITLNAMSIRVGGFVSLRDGFRAVGEVRLLGAEIGGQLVCSGGSFQNEDKIALNAQCVKVATNVDLCGKFNGRVSFAGAEIGGQIDCAGGSFQNEKGVAFNAQGIRVASDVFLNDGFKSVGEVSLLGADIGGQLVCAGGSFQNEGKISLNAQSIKVASSVFMSASDSAGECAKVFNAKGRVDLAGADIGGQLNCEGGIFRNERDIALNAHGIKVASDVLLIPHVRNKRDEWENFSANGLVSFVNATIGGNFMLHSCKLTHLSLAGANVLGEFRDDANIYKDQNGNDIVLDIDGFRYHRLNVAKEREKDRLEWVGLMSKVDRFYPQPYEQLMKVYREMGHMNLARKVGFEFEKKRHKQLRLNRDHKRFVVLGWAWWMWCWILRATIGYGYKPFRILWWFPIAIVGGWLLFSGAMCPQKWTSASAFASTLGHGITEQSECERWRMLPSDVGALVSPEWRDGEVPPEGYPKFIPLFYAIEVALPVLALGQTSNWQPESLGLKWIQGIFIIIGAVALAIPASYRTGFLNPRWWD